MPPRIEITLPPESPCIGDKIRFRTKAGLIRYNIWSACVNCGKPKWTRILRNEPMNLLCRKCAIARANELVHHKNGIKDDNRIENLSIATRGNHSLDHSKGYRDGFTKGYLDGRNKRIIELENVSSNLKREVSNAQ